MKIEEKIILNPPNEFLTIVIIIIYKNGKIKFVEMA